MTRCISSTIFMFPFLVAFTQWSVSGVLTWGWPCRSRTGAPWSRGPPGRASRRCWCCRRSGACWPASCSPLRSWGAGTRSPSPSAASPPPSAASWTPASASRWPRRPGPAGGSGKTSHSRWTRRPWPCSPSQPPNVRQGESQVLIKMKWGDMTWTFKMFAPINWFESGFLQGCVTRVYEENSGVEMCVIPTDLVFRQVKQLIEKCRKLNI